MPRSVATVPLAETDEPLETLTRLIEDYGATSILRAMSRALRDARKARRTEGELDAARALRTAALSCLEQSLLLAKEGV